MMMTSFYYCLFLVWMSKISIFIENYFSYQCNNTVWFKDRTGTKPRNLQHSSRRDAFKNLTESDRFTHGKERKQTRSIYALYAGNECKRDRPMENWGNENIRVRLRRKSQNTQIWERLYTMKWNEENSKIICMLTNTNIHATYENVVTKRKCMQRKKRTKRKCRYCFMFFFYSMCIFFFYILYAGWMLIFHFIISSYVIYDNLHYKYFLHFLWSSFDCSLMWKKLKWNS